MLPPPDAVDPGGERAASGTDASTSAAWPEPRGSAAPGCRTAAEPGTRPPRTRRARVVGAPAEAPGRAAPRKRAPTAQAISCRPTGLPGTSRAGAYPRVSGERRHPVLARADRAAGVHIARERVSLSRA